MEIVNIEAGTFKEMVTAWNSLKSELKESLQHLRNSGTLSFTRIDKKIFYRKQDVVSLLTTVQKKK